MLTNSPPAHKQRPIHDLLDRHEAARLLGISPRTLDRWHLLRVGPPRIRYGRTVRYRGSAIEQWLQDHETAILDIG